MLAAGSPFANDICAGAACGIDMAIARGEADIPLETFAKRILRLYDPDAHVEVLNFENSHFDPLFAVAAVADAAKRLSGYRRGILVVSSLERAGVPSKGKMTPARKSAFAENMETVENYLMRYELPNVEIIFV